METVRATLVAHDIPTQSSQFPPGRRRARCGLGRPLDSARAPARRPGPEQPHHARVHRHRTPGSGPQPARVHGRARRAGGGRVRRRQLADAAGEDAGRESLREARAVGRIQGMRDTRRLPRGARSPGRRRGDDLDARPLARADGRRGTQGRQGRLARETHDALRQRRPHHRQPREAAQPRLPRGQRVPLARALPPRRGAGAQRAPRHAAHDPIEFAARAVSGRTGGRRHAARRVGLRHVARARTAGALHAEARARAARPPQPSGLVSQPPVRRRHAHQLGRAPQRHRDVGERHRAHRSHRSAGHGQLPRRRGVERARELRRDVPVRQRRPDDVQDGRAARPLRGRQGLAAGQLLEVRRAPRPDRGEFPHHPEGTDRRGRVALPAPERARGLHRGGQDARPDDGGRRGRTAGDDALPPAAHRHRAWRRDAAVGSRQRTLSE